MKFRFISLILLIAFCMGSLVSCNIGGSISSNETKESASEQESNLPSNVSDIPLVVNGKINFKVITGSVDSSNVDNAAAQFNTLFDENFGIKPAEPTLVKWSSTTYDDYCVIFGQNTGININDFQNLRVKDYFIKINGKCIFIGACSEEYYIQAAKTLIAQLKKCTSGEKDTLNITLPGNYEKIQTGRYSIMNLTINGVNLSEYKLLKPTDKNITTAVINNLKDSITSCYGYELETTTKEVDEEKYIRLVVDPTKTDLMSYGYTVENGDLIIRAGGYFSMYMAAKRFSAIVRTKSSIGDIDLLNGDNTSITLLDNPNGLSRAKNTNLRLIACNLQADGEETAFKGWSDTGDINCVMRTEIFEKWMEIYDPDVIGLQEASQTWHTFFAGWTKKSNWAYAGMNTGTGITYYVNPIVYRTDRFTLIADGNAKFVAQCNSMPRYMSWAVLQNKTDGTKFVVVNTHWCGTSRGETNTLQAQETLAKVKELQKQYNCEVYVTGDFNTRDRDPLDADYTLFLDSGTLLDAKYNTERLVKDDGDVHGWGPTASKRLWSYAHIFVTSGTIVRQFDTAWDNYEQYESDHGWLVADIDVKTK